MLSINDSSISKDRKELAAHITTQVNALPNLTEKQRETVIEMAAHWAFSNGTAIQKKEVDGKVVVTVISEPNYAGLANHVIQTLKIS
jgi:predicted nuclease with RNAse H fold